MRLNQSAIISGLFDRNQCRAALADSSRRAIKVFRRIADSKDETVVKR
jgi:hypothetical protein